MANGPHPGVTTQKPGSTGQKPGTAGERPGSGTHPNPGSHPSSSSDLRAKNETNRPISRPQGTPTVARTSGGGSVAKYHDGTTVNKDASGKVTHYGNPAHGVNAWFNKGGGSHITQKLPGGGKMDVRTGPNNQRVVERSRPGPNGTERAVSFGHNRGFVERPIAGRTGYVQRTTVYGTRTYASVYHSYSYHGVVLYRPVPAFVFAPAFYGWMVTPWSAPVYYAPAAWGWVGQPWYGYYGSVFTPYPVYNSGDQWLTDYVIAANYQQVYQDQTTPPDGSANGAPQASEPPPPQAMSAEDKALLNQDIKNNIQREQQAANNPTPSQGSTEDQVPEALQDHLFTVYAAPVEATLSAGGSCSLAEGDMLVRKGDSPNPDNSVDVLVRLSHANASHPGLCASQTPVRVQLADLQEMYNHKKELLAEGEQKQSELQGKHHGLPKGPKPQRTEVASGQAQPADDVTTALNEMAAEADQTQQQVLSASN